jgi:hypothetical protein
MKPVMIEDEPRDYGADRAAVDPLLVVRDVFELSHWIDLGPG